MCYHKSLVVKIQELLEHYSASFSSINADLELTRHRFRDLRMRSEEGPLSKEEINELKWAEKTLASFGEDEIHRFHEHGFDYLPTPVITAGAPGELKMFRWGLIPFFMASKEKAFALRPSTLNCISEEMYDKPSYRDAAKNNQRCLIPITGFYEWKWLDEKGKTKIPYYISSSKAPVISLAGLYSRWKDKTTDEYLYTYTVLTTTANPLMEEIHNSKKRMPVIIPAEYEKDWLNKNLTKDDVLALCRPAEDQAIKAHTVSKLITTKEADTNVEDVLKEVTY